MASRVEFGVSATQIASVAAGENTAVDTISADVGKTLGGSASVATSLTSTGFTSGVAQYLSAPDTTAGGTVNVGASAAFDFVFIKNTGYKYDTATTLGASTSATLKITLGSQEICTIPAGGAIVLPSTPSGQFKANSTHSSDKIAVEYLMST